MRILVIGGTGNISSGVVAALLERNHQVVLFNRGQRPGPPPPDVQVIYGDRRYSPHLEPSDSGGIKSSVIPLRFTSSDIRSACADSTS